MADEDTPVEDEAMAEDEGEDAGSTKKKGKTPGKRLVLRVVLPVVALLAIGGGVFMSGVADGLLGGKPAEKGAETAEPEPEDPKDLVYYELPEMLVNLTSEGRRTHFLKIKVSLELSDPSDVERVEAILPRIVDNFQVYLRELRLEDLQGSAGLYRLREELLTRVTLAAAPAKVSDVLFREMIVQ